MPQHSTNQKVVFITGASSGIGRSLAFAYASHYAKQGLVLGLISRRETILSDMKSQIEKEYKSIRVEISACDITSPSTPTLLETLTSRTGIPTIMVLNAGIGHQGKQIGQGDISDDAAVIETNLVGAMRVCHWVVGVWERVGCVGHVVGVSSVAAWRGLPTSAAYSASKAGLDVYLDALRVEKYGKIKVTVLHPGYIDTPINDMMEHRPYLISADKAAQLVLSRIERGVRQAFIPWWPWTVVARLLAMLPTWVLALAARKFTK
ncbi:uncharacterized protein SPPG_07326 [Spizellomyces punctatus DAOM BR117]|uniref:Uncharacterized protein n=1 Tax=Spizellomyces punctatus (strain DAOM BR117) TaxID=645134 RepID=A0A0L0H8Y2_SPIPD|nr:uncharacterized protein SPPG_07326 [Spizellomyces punctatus DAOM BR117]KNC97399.1 hypothetical protein SPPG_07326 [Spizellomyces punctatus DAOM BR117]|eukprot:XP_016605439.1 hypothetical protein SPPG_07326 [Spizellomyces punctatus DAOM BR117]